MITMLYTLMAVGRRIAKMVFFRCSENTTMKLATIPTLKSMVKITRKLKKRRPKNLGRESGYAHSAVINTASAVPRLVYLIVFQYACGTELSLRSER